MFSSVKSDILADASGNATVFLSHSNLRNPNGFIEVIKYTPGTLDTGATLTITGESSGIPIMTKVGAGTIAVWYYPRAPLNSVADGSVAANGSEFIPIKDERIKVVVSGGGNAGAGSIEVLLINDPPY